MKTLAGRVAFVTGSSRGIGAAIARELGNCGATTIVNYRESLAEAEATCVELRGNGTIVEAMRCDVSSRDEVRQTVRAIEEKHGGIDILVNNAGILRDRSFSNMSDDDWDSVLSVNLQGTVNVTSAVIPGMLAHRHGRIVNISSFVAQAGNFGQTNYATSKAGIIGFTRALAIEVAKHDVTVNAICPGFIETEMWSSIPEAVRQNILARVPMKRVGQPREVARLVRFLVAEGDYITGQTMNINGGLFIG